MNHTSNLNAINAANEAKAAAERAVCGGLAFDLSAFSRHRDIKPEWFDYPQHRAVYVALYAYHRTHPTATQCGPSALIHYISTTPELTGPFSDSNGASLDDIHSIIANGHFDVDLLKSNVDVLREAAFQQERRELLARIERYPQHRFLREMEEAVTRWKSQQAATGNGMPVSGLKVLNANEVTPEKIDWLWKNRIPLGMLSYVAGDAGQGKSLVFDGDIPARLSVGAAMPDGSPGIGPADSVLLCAEDDPAHVTVPRLIRAGADLSRIKIVETALMPNPNTGELERQQFDANVHVPLLANVLRTLPNPKLVVIDPVTEYLGKTDTNKSNEVRNALRKVVDLAAEFRVAVICLAHPNKGGSLKAINKAGGSGAFVALSRAYWLVGTDPEDEDRHYILPAKINIAPQIGGLAYRIQSDGQDEPPFVHWESDVVDMNGNQFLEKEAKAFAAKGRIDDESELTRAVEFVRNQLSDGPMLTNELKAAVRANDISDASFRRAKGQLEVRADKEHGKNKPWWTLLPGQTIPQTEGAQTPLNEHHEHVEHVEHLPFNDSREGVQGVQGAQENKSKRVEHVPSEDDHLTPTGRRKPRRKKSTNPRKAPV